MSNLVSALNGVKAKGFAEVSELGLSGMITLRGDLESKEMAKAIKDATGAKVPATRKVSFGDKGSVVWMSPDELLVLVDYAATGEAKAALEAALAGQHFLAEVVSDARAHFRISGDAAYEALAKVMPVDFSTFEAGDFRRSRLSQVAAAVWKTETGDFELVCFRSVAQYVFDVLRTASTKGSEVAV